MNLSDVEGVWPYVVVHGILIFAASCYFYMAFIPVYILILGFTIVIDYFAGLYLEKAGPKNKKLLLINSKKCHYTHLKDNLKLSGIDDLN